MKASLQLSRGRGNDSGGKIWRRTSRRCCHVVGGIGDQVDPLLPFLFFSFLGAIEKDDDNFMEHEIFDIRSNRSMMFEEMRVERVGFLDRERSKHAFSD